MKEKIKALLNNPLGFAGLFSAGLGGLVIFGWYSNNRSLIQIHDSFVPMQYNTALGFVLIGFCIIFSLLGQKTLKFASSVSLLCLGGLTLLQYFLGTDFGIDQMFMDHYITTKTSHPGRMAPNTALCFFLASLLFLPGLSGRKFSNKLFGIIAPLFAGLGLVALLGYIFSIETAFGWQKFTRMAVHTSFGFVVVGLAYTFVHLKPNYLSNNRAWLPFPISLLCLLVFVLLGQNIKSSSVKSETASAQGQSKVLSGKISDGLNEYIRAFERLSKRISYHKESNFKFWKKDARDYVEDFGFYKALEVSNKNHIVDWVYPIEGNESAVGLDLKLNNDQLLTLETAKAQNKIKITKLINLAQGGRGVLLVKPLFDKDIFIGSSIGVIDINRLFSNLAIEHGSDNFYIKVWANNQKIFSNSTLNTNSKSYRHSVHLDKLDSDWELEVVPNQTFYENHRSQSGELTIIFGIFISMLLGFIVSQYLARDDLFKKLEQERLKIMQASKMASLGQLSAGVAHEVNNPLAVIKGSSELISRFRESPEKIDYAISKIQNNVDRIAQIVGGLKKYSRRSEKLNISSQSIKVTISESLFLVESKSNRKNVKLIVEEAIESSLNFDEVQITQVITNLLSNAIDAAAETQESWVKIQTSDSSDFYKIIVQDSGKGIPEENIEKIFEPFFTTKEVGKGTGLGLSISQGILNDHSGSLTYELLNGYTTFIVSLPKLRGQNAA